MTIPALIIPADPFSSYVLALNTPTTSTPAWAVTVSINLDLFLTTKFVNPVPALESSPKSRAK